MITMTDGCAGFFTEEEIENSGGIILTPQDQAPQPGCRPADWPLTRSNGRRPSIASRLVPRGGTLRVTGWREPVPMAAESYNEAQLDALRAGDLEACFGPTFAGLQLGSPPRIPGGRLRLVHRVVELDPTGGRYGLGLIRAEADIKPDDWFLTCHFVDDMVMPGTLMYECCHQTLRIFLLRMGWVAEHGQAGFEPCPDVPGKLRCRGPVTPKTSVVTHEVHVKELGYQPEPYAVADAFMYADGKRIVRFMDMSLRLTGVTRERIEDTWRAAGRVPRGARQKTETGSRPLSTTSKGTGI
jgi:3-hydroxymyristoyl/3-hydroxydecanoyl-(acyl carrier protein) dehydratase